MIFIEPGEQNSESRLSGIIIKNSVPCPKLEALTGADLMVTSWSKPPTSKRIIQKHLDRGALLVQRKSIADLLESMQAERVYRQIARMREYKVSTRQTILLSVGLYLPNRKTKVRKGTFDGRTIKWRHTGTGYAAFRAQLSALGDTVRVEHLAHEQELPAWLADRERAVLTYAKEKDLTKVIYDRPLREMKRGTDWWWSLTIFEHWGERRAKDAGEFLEALGVGTLIHALEYFSNEHNMNNRPPGIGARCFTSIRAGLGLTPDRILLECDRADTVYNAELRRITEHVMHNGLLAEDIEPFLEQLRTAREELTK